MPTPYQLAQKFRAALLRRDADALREITAAYDRVVTSLQLTVSALSAETARARAAGQAVNAAWLFRERRLQLLLDQAEQQLAHFTAQLNTRLTNDQRTAVTLAQVHTQQMLRAAGVEADLTYSRLPASAIENLVGFSGDGAPLTKLLNQIPGDATPRIRETLITALATGQNPRQTARQLSDALEGNKARALTIARTETLRAYREASRQTAKAAGVMRYEWISSKSQRTCLVCLAMDGKIFSIEKPQPAHPNCRCAVLYLPPNYTPPARETGAQWFERQPDEVKAAMMSHVAFEALKRGEVTLQDFVGVRRSRVWGETRYERSWREIEKRRKAGTLTGVPSLKAKGRAKGSFFANKETLPYTATGVIRGQSTESACVPAVCRMLIFDRFPELEDDINFSESYLRHFLNTGPTGSVIADIPSVLQMAKIDEYQYRNDLTFDDLREAVRRGAAVASVYKKSNETGHVLIVEEITDTHVAVRDSLPENTGSSYRVRWEDFLAVWLSPKTQRGIGVIVVK
jgi:SPP1 gp7 family putative phage head morphogenesis protein